MKKFFVAVFNLMLVLIPVILLAGGLWISSGTLWDVTIVLAMVGIIAFSLNKYRAVRRRDEQLESARALVAIFGTVTAFFILAAQTIFCHISGAQSLVAEAAIAWLLSLLAAGLVSAMIKERPKSKALCWGFVLAIGFISVCVCGFFTDFYEYFSGQEIPERLSNFIGALAGITAIGALIGIVIGIIAENRRN